MDIPIKVPLPERLNELLAEPICVQLPPPAKVELNLPTGGKIQGLVDITNAIPTDCSLSFSLLLQLGPILANLDCLFKIIRVLEPMIKVVTALPNMIEVGKAMPKLVEAVPPLVECIAKFLGLGLPLFLRDLLLLIIKILNCVVGQLKSILAVMGGLSLQIQSAQSAGNSELLAALQCAQDNAATSAGHSLSAIDPVLALLSLAEPMLGVAGVNPIKIPAIGSDTDIAALQTVVTTLDELTQVLQLVADGLGG